MSVKKILFIFFTVCLVPVLAWAQGDGSFRAGPELQVYPAGFIPGIQAEWDLNGRSAIHLRLGYNITDRQDFGEHDNEEGGGAGFGFGYRRYLQGTLRGVFFGTRTDLWFMEIDWRDDNPLRRGTTEITVFQPTGEVGYDFLKNNPDWKLATTVSFGFEINVKTEGEEVGEGAIILGGINLRYNF